MFLFCPKIGKKVLGIVFQVLYQFNVCVCDDDLCLNVEWMNIKCGFYGIIWWKQLEGQTICFCLFVTLGVYWTVCHCVYLKAKTLAKKELMMIVILPIMKSSSLCFESRKWSSSHLRRPSWAVVGGLSKEFESFLVLTIWHLEPSLSFVVMGKASAGSKCIDCNFLN